jgi:protein-S-isoprenylcysteine O-methyltransferase Ste14
MLSPKMAAFSIGTVVLEFVLVIAVAGGVAMFFAQPAYVALTIITALLVVAASFSDVAFRTGTREDKSNRWIFAALAVPAILVIVVPPWSDRHDVLTIGGPWMRWVGVVIYTIGGVLRLAPTFILGKRFSALVAIQPGHKLVTTGLYAHIRHPSYLGMLVGLVGWSLCFRSLAGVILTALVFIPLHGRMQAEDKLLAEHFGAEYEAWRARTARLVPGLY